MWISLVVVVAVALFGSMLYTKILETFGLTESSQQHGTHKAEYEEFNPYTPIEVVPNDYDPSKDK